MSTREDIITAMLDLGEEKGLANVSLSDIALEVGIRKASIYSHFESQQAIIDAMLRYCHEELGKRSFLVDFKAKDARTMLVGLFDNIIKVFAEKPISSFFSMMSMEISSKGTPNSSHSVLISSITSLGNTGVLKLSQGRRSPFTSK